MDLELSGKSKTTIVTGLAEVRRRVPMPVATGESETTRFAFRDIVEQRASDFL
jgi:L-alanine-DL-glutamate epimerase-like enolase superfamily enzyme